jgi:Zn-dependent peptidase ImmA (M78 family)
VTEVELVPHAYGLPAVDTVTHAMPGRDTNIGAKRARDTRAALGVAPDAPLDVLALVEERAGVPVIVASLPDPIAGGCYRAGGAAVLWVNGDQPLVRQRFTLAHELGHVRLAHEVGMNVDAVAVLAGETRDAREVQANAFAAELLAPRAGVMAMIDGEPGLETVVDVAARYGISNLAALYRLSTLGLSARVERLREELEEGLAAHFERPAYRDRLASIRSLPRLSPAIAGSRLAEMTDAFARLGAA